MLLWKEWFNFCFWFAGKLFAGFSEIQSTNNHSRGGSLGLTAGDDIKGI